MRSVKPGRGPSFMGGATSLAMVVFGIFWTIMAASMGAPVFFPVFGMIFVFIGIMQAVYNFRNATGKNRYSTFDITDDNEEPDPLNERFGQAVYCPYCGEKINGDFHFCPRCGKKLP